MRAIFLVWIIEPTFSSIIDPEGAARAYGRLTAKVTEEESYFVSDEDSDTDSALGSEGSEIDYK